MDHITSKPIKITEHGQITIPKKFREQLDSDLIFLEITSDDKITINPISSVAGSLYQYAKNTTKSFDKIRIESWEKSTSK